VLLALLGGFSGSVILLGRSLDGSVLSGFLYLWNEAKFCGKSLINFDGTTSGKNNVTGRSAYKDGLGRLVRNLKVRHVRNSTNACDS
jgi:hypothetical protein